MKEFIKKHLLIIVFIIAGGIAGFLYWKFVGCLSGTCIIKSVWYMSTIYGMAVGWILGSLTGDLAESFKKRKKA
ncbi:MAG TPA: DUF6132 family protein [Bacteroidales bacterium]|nr:DUF6132 family protein [Bacteroidales bacterium]